MTQPQHLLLRVPQQTRDGPGVPHVLIPLELDADLDSAVAPQVTSDIPARRRGVSASGGAAGRGRTGARLTNLEHL
jgi:hypothetical protein